jgi:hypothetical protein
VFAFLRRREWFLGLLIALLVLGALFGGFFYVMNPAHHRYSDDACLDVTWHASMQLGDAERHQDVAGMAAAYDLGVKGLTICSRDPHRDLARRKRYRRALTVVQRAAANWHAFAAAGKDWPPGADAPDIMLY